MSFPELREIARRIERAEAEQLARTGDPGREGAIEVAGGLAVSKGPGSPFSAALGASCRSPIAGHARLADGQLELDGLVGSADGSTVLADRISGPAGDGPRLGVELAHRLLAAGAAKLL